MQLTDFLHVTESISTRSLMHKGTNRCIQCAAKAPRFNDAPLQSADPSSTDRSTHAAFVNSTGSGTGNVKNCGSNRLARFVLRNGRLGGVIVVPTEWLGNQEGTRKYCKLIVRYFFNRRNTKCGAGATLVLLQAAVIVCVGSCVECGGDQNSFWNLLAL